MTDEPGAPDDLDMLAAEYALGMLDSAAKAGAEARIATDEDFAARVVRWEAVGHRWASAAPAYKDWSPDALWDRLEASFAPEHEERALPLPANDTQVPPAAPSSSSVWRGGAIAASLTALLLGGLYLGERARVEEFGEKLAATQSRGVAATSAIRVAQVSQADGAPLLTVMYEGDDGKLTARIASIAQDDLVPELWVIGPDGKPRSLGQAAGGSVFVIELTDQMRADIAAGSKIAISLEEAAGKPSLQPTPGRILGAAQLAPVT